ncbi:MAG: PilZ domain-containing protein [Synechococcus sp.]|nr:PilZ domain-containing protein [Synechococcus sp.]
MTPRSEPENRNTAGTERQSRRAKLMNLLQQDVRTLLSPSPESATPQRATPKAAPRTHQRVHAPIGPAAISGKLHVEGGETFPVKLWDVSDRGLCLHTRQRLPLAPGYPVRLELLGTQAQQQLLLEGSVCWVEEGGGSSMHFLGVQLLDSAPDLRQTFLASLLSSP